MDDGRIGHAEITIGDGVLYLADEYPELGLKAPAPRRGFGEPDAACRRHRRRLAAGTRTWRHRRARDLRELRNAQRDHHRPVRTPLDAQRPDGQPVAGIRHGDIGYVSVWAPDADRAAAFYGHVLGWTYDRSTHQVTNTELPTGISARRRSRPPCSAATRSRMCRAARAAITRGGRCGRRNPSHRLRRAARRHRPAGRGIRRLRAGRRARNVRNSTDPGRASSRMSPTRCRTRPCSASSTAGCWDGPSSPAGWRTAGRFGDPPDGRRRGRQPASE